MRAKQPFAVAMKDRTPFGLGGLWENWRSPQSGEWIRTVAIMTVPSNAHRADPRSHAADLAQERLRALAQ